MKVKVSVKTKFLQSVDNILIYSVYIAGVTQDIQLQGYTLF